jgi:ThiF family
VLALAECDVIFGCMDTVEGRHVLNRLCTFYLIPYFDVGVKLDADGRGGIDSISGAVHYLQPGKSSLLSRGVYSMDQVEAEGMRRTNPGMYEQQMGEGYLRGVDEDRPAVISVNAFFSALTVNEFLARLHPYRNQPNANFAAVRANLAEVQFFPETEGATCLTLFRHVGKGDVEPLLERPELS